ncbi:MAG TPA: transporter substrate-binding domain-containing protein [Azospirillum sp.]|nr:transporter substrate-binding domain-containing protein [Azospirillum sp.]
MMWTRFLATLLVTGMFAAHADAADRLFIGTGVGAPYVQEDRQGFLDLLVAEAFRRLGHEAEIAFYPSAERALMNADSGADDGDALRVRGLEAIYPNLIRVPEKVIDNNFVAYSLRYDVATTGWEALKPFHVSFIIGWKIFEANLRAGFQTTSVQNADQLFTLLAADRADLVLYEEWQGRWIARQRGLPVKVLDPPLLSTEMFMYLNRKHAALVEPVAEALRAMKADGSYHAIAERTLLPLTLGNGGGNGAGP